MKITRILLLLLLSINLHAQTDSLELENLKRKESSTISKQKINLLKQIKRRTPKIH